MPEKISVKKGEDGVSVVSVKLDEMPDIQVKKKIKVLWYSDFLRHTGFGNVAEEIVSRLEKTGRYSFEILAINTTGDPYNFPLSEYNKFKNIPIWPCRTPQRLDDMFGYDRLVKLLAQKDFDIFFALQDSFNMMPIKDAILEAKKVKKFSYIFYFPVDGDIRYEWVENAVKIADYPIVYSKYGYNKVKELSPSINIAIIPHGVNLETFKPFKDEYARKYFRENYFDIKDEKTFLITNVNRNQPRKDLPRCITAFREFCIQNPDIEAKLYLHCHPRDGAGHRLSEFVRNYLPPKIAKKVLLPDPDKFGENGYPVEILTQIYAASDVVTSTTLGEGWGLSTVEAMACKTPVAIPDNSASHEILGGDKQVRGYLVKSGNTPNMFTVMKYDNEVLRPLTDIEDLVRVWKHIYDNPAEAKQKVENAYKWLETMTWDRVVQEWDKLFQSIAR